MRKTPAAAMTIGAVSRATGLSPDLLRVWQRRYGFPLPERKISGHRLYSLQDVRRLRRISEALSRGHRPSQVVALPADGVEALLAEDGPAFRASSATRAIATLFEHVRHHRRAELVAALLADASAMGPMDFLADRMIPLNEAVGDAWARGDVSIHQEHFFSESAEDILRSIRLPLECAARGPVVLFATLSGETHRLGLLMAAVVTAASGARPHLAGADLPVGEIADAWVLRNASAIGLSISISTGGAAAHRSLEQLRRLVPSHVPIFAGGKGARRSHPPAGVAVVDDFGRLAAWLRGLRSNRSE